MHPELIKVIVGRNYFEMERDTVILKMKSLGVEDSLKKLSELGR